jgi:hypothetical protein
LDGGEAPVQRVHLHQRRLGKPASRQLAMTAATRAECTDLVRRWPRDAGGNSV